LVAVRALVLLGAVCFTIVTAFARRDRQTFTWTAVVAAMLWLVWIYEMIQGLGAPEVRSAPPT
jgi:hypothetical protein